MKKIALLLAILMAFSSVLSINTFASENTEITEADTQASETVEEVAQTGDLPLPTEEPEEVTMPKIESINRYNSYIKFNFSTVENASSYMLFVKNPSLGKWVKIGTTKTNSFIYKSSPWLKNYYYTVRAMNNNGVLIGEYDKAGTPFTLKLDTPVITKCENITDGVKVTWDTVPGAAKYRLFFKKPGQSYLKVIDTVNTYASAKLTKKWTLYYTVRCVTKDGKTFTSNYNKDGYEFTNTPAPTIVGVANTVNGVKFAWKAVSGINKYSVYYKDNNNSYQLIDKINATNYTLTTAVSGHTYRFAVKCCDDEGNNLSGNRFSKSIKYLKAPKITSVTEDCSDMIIRWGKVPGAAKYKLFRKVGGKWKYMITTSATSYTYSDGYCDFYYDGTGGTYSFTVRCCDSKGKTFTSAYDTTGYAHTYTYVPTKKKVQLKCPYLSQTALGAGCETYATTMLLKFHKFKISEFTFASKWLIQKPVSGGGYGPDMDSAMAGTVYQGYGINAKGMAKCVNSYLKSTSTSKRAYADYSHNLQYLCNKYVQNGIPVCVWSTSQLAETGVAATWTINYVNGSDHKPMGSKEKWYRHEHCLVLIGYDFPNRRYIYNDSLCKDRKVGVSNWAKVRSEDRFITLGRMSMVVK